jgi:hypothetical protein
MTSATVPTTPPHVNGTRKVAELDWSDVMTGSFPESLARTAWRHAVATVAERAKAALPEANGRIDAAVKLVLAGDVEPLPDGTAKVASQSNGATAYHIVNGTCQCKDAPKAPQGLCKHRLAAAIHRRATTLVTQRLTQLDGDNTAPQAAAAPLADAPVASTLPEAPASANVYIDLAGRKVQVTPRDVDETRLLVRLEAVLARFPSVEAPSEQEAPEGWCSRHNVAMTRSKDGKHFYHKVGETPEGKALWCRGK